MEGYEKKEGMETNDREEIYSKAVRAGKRTYFFDVKATRNNDYYLTITESKKKFDDNGTQNFEKHKIFLYREDFEKFMNGLNEAINFINQKEMLEVIGDMNAKADAKNVIDADADANIEAALEMNEKGMELDGEIKIDIDFEEPTL